MTINYKELSNAFCYSFKEAFKWRIWKWLLTGSLGALSGTLQFGEKFFSLNKEKSILYAFIGLVSLFLLRFILIFFKESFKYFHETYKNSVYGEAIIILKDSFANAHAYRKRDGYDDTEFMRIMITFCNNLRDIYNKITDADCSVSLKVPRYDTSVSEHTILTNLTRDVKHGNRDTKTYTETKHNLLGNTAFTYCFNKVMTNAKEKHYINNKINETDNYLSTSKVCYDNGILPYNSELVIPIVPIVPNSDGNLDCHGFLCVDCDVKGAFHSKYDIALLEGVADGIYDLISLRNNFNSFKNIE